jgi:hypothetical protein
LATSDTDKIDGRARSRPCAAGLPRRWPPPHNPSPRARLRIDVLAQTLHETSRARFNTVGVFMTKRLRNHAVSGLRTAGLAAALMVLAAFAASPARADRCDDTANYIYLSHPAAKELSLGCRGENFSIELYAKTDRKPKPEFYNLVAAAAAIIFTVPKDDTATGTARCIKRMGILRGDKISMRFRRLNMECSRTKTEASIVVTRGKDE